jgi:hypothetical protein
MGGLGWGGLVVGRVGSSRLGSGWAGLFAACRLWCFAVCWACFLPCLFCVIIPIPEGWMGGNGCGLHLELVVAPGCRPRWLTGVVVRARHGGWGGRLERGWIRTDRQTDRQTDRRSRTQRNEVKLYTPSPRCNVPTAEMMVIEEPGCWNDIACCTCKIKTWSEVRLGSW